MTIKEEFEDFKIVTRDGIEITMKELLGNRLTTEAYNFFAGKMKEALEESVQWYKSDRFVTEEEVEQFRQDLFNKYGLN